MAAILQTKWNNEDGVFLLSTDRSINCLESVSSSTWRGIGFSSDRAITRLLALPGSFPQLGSDLANCYLPIAIYFFNGIRSTSITSTEFELKLER